MKPDNLRENTWVRFCELPSTAVVFAGHDLKITECTGTVNKFAEVTEANYACRPRDAVLFETHGCKQHLFPPR